MPAPQRREPVAVAAQLLDDPYRFSFFQAVRLLERWLLKGQGLDNVQTLARRIGFRNNLSLAFPPSEIAALRIERRVPATEEGASSDEKSADESLNKQGYADANTIERVELTPAFFGLLGAGGAMPTHYTEQLAERELLKRGPDKEAPRAFYDIFQHRAMVLFYEGWRKHRLAVQFEADRHNRYLPMMLAVAGIGHPGLRNRLRAKEGGVSDDSLAFFAGTLQRRPVSATTLQRMLAHYFDVPVALENFIGRWFTLPKASRSHLGQSNMALGRDFVMGERVWQRDLRLRLTFGPMVRERFRRFLPGGAAAVALKELLALMTGATLEYEVRLTLCASEVKGCRLGADAPQLGWDSFLITRASREDRTDVSYDLLALT